MRVEVYRDDQGCDEFLFGSYRKGEVDGNFDPAVLNEVRKALSEQLEVVTSLISSVGKKPDYTTADVAVFGRIVGADGCVQLNKVNYYTGRRSGETVVLKTEGKAAFIMVQIGKWTEMEPVTFVVASM